MRLTKTQQSAIVKMREVGVELWKSPSWRTGTTYTWHPYHYTNRKVLPSTAEKLAEIGIIEWVPVTRSVLGWSFVARLKRASSALAEIDPEEKKDLPLDTAGRHCTVVPKESL